MPMRFRGSIYLILTSNIAIENVVLIEDLRIDDERVKEIRRAILEVASMMLFIYGFPSK